jgi:hypothetical protein
MVWLNPSFVSRVLDVSGGQMRHTRVSGSALAKAALSIVVSSFSLVLTASSASGTEPALVVTPTSAWTLAVPSGNLTTTPGGEIANSTNSGLESISAAGTQLWNASPNSGDFTVTDALGNTYTTILVGSTWYLTSFSETGAQLWETSIPDGTNYIALGRNGEIYIAVASPGSSSGVDEVLGFDESTGAQVQTMTGFSNVTDLFSYANGLVVVDYVYGVDYMSYTGAVVATIQEGPIVSAPIEAVVDANGVTFLSGTTDSVNYCYNVSVDETVDVEEITPAGIQWTWTEPATTTSCSDALAATPDGGVIMEGGAATDYSLNSDGSLQWTYELSLPPAPSYAYSATGFYDEDPPLVDTLGNVALPYEFSFLVYLGNTPAIQYGLGVDFVTQGSDSSSTLTPIELLDTTDETCSQNLGQAAIATNQFFFETTQVCGDSTPTTTSLSAYSEPGLSENYALTLSVPPGPAPLLVAFGDSVSAGEGDPAPSIPGPTGLLVATSDAGGTLRAGTYSYEVTAVEPGGETYGSPVVATITNAAHSVTNRGSVTLTWNDVAGATSYNIYGRPPSNASSLSNTGVVNGPPSLGLIGSVDASTSETLSFADTGKTAPDMKQPPPTPYEGFSHGFSTDSPDAYPAVLANQLGMSVNNFSISGACAGPGTSRLLTNCQPTPATEPNRPTVAGEIQGASRMGLHPSLITVSDGADDIDFEDCFASLIGLTSEQCQVTAPDLQLLKENLDNDFAEIHKDWPGVPIILDLYFNPLPTSYADTNTSSNSVCSVLYDAQQVVQLAQYATTADALLAGTSSSAVRAYYNSTLSKAQSLLDRLNQTLQSAAAAALIEDVGVTTVQLDFTGHDVCQDYPGGTGGWVFGPNVFFFASARAYVGLTYQKTFLPTDTCAVFDAGCRLVYSIEKGGSGGFGYELILQVNANDVPHPTITGQTAIANQLEQTAEQLLN